MSSRNPYRSPETYQEPMYPPRRAPTNQNLAWVLFSFDGRIPRRVFWGVSLLAALVFYLVLLLGMAALGPESDAVLALMVILYVPFLWVSLAVQVKRWHDRDKSGWFVLIAFIPIIGPIWAFVETGCLRGTEGPNMYGPDPT